MLGAPAGPAQLAVVPGVPAGAARPAAGPGRHAASLSSAGPAAARSIAPSVEPAPDEVPPAPPRLSLVPAPVEATPEPTPEPTPRARAARAPRGPAPLDGELPFTVWTPKPAGDRKVLDSLADAKAARAVRRVLTAGLRTEGPVHRERLVRVTAGAFGLSRVSPARREALLGLLPEGSGAGDFVWPADLDPATWTGFHRQSAGADRPLAQVAPEEIGNAMVALCRAHEGMTRSALYVATLEVFGHRRQTPALLPSLEAGLGTAVAAGRLTEQPGGGSPPDRRQRLARLRNPGAQGSKEVCW